MVAPLIRVPGAAGATAAGAAGVFKRQRTDPPDPQLAALATFGNRRFGDMEEWVQGVEGKLHGV